MSNFKTNKIRDEFVDKVSGVYLTLIGNEGKNYVDVKILWRWVKDLIQYKKVQESNNSLINVGNNKGNQQQFNTEVIIYYLPYLYRHLKYIKISVKILSKTTI